MLLMYEYKKEKLYRFELYTANWKKNKIIKNNMPVFPANPWLLVKLHYNIQNKLTLSFSRL